MANTGDDYILGDLPPIVVMGVSGSGKSTVGALLAERLGAVFLEGDDFHSADSKTKMAAGVPLADADRGPWLANIADRIRRERAIGRVVVVACSALKHSYRDTLAEAEPGMIFVHLALPRDIIARRQSERVHEYMPSSLLDSQFATLEPPGDDESHLTLDVAPSPDELVRTIIAHLPASAAPGGAEAAMPHR